MNIKKTFGAIVIALVLLSAIVTTAAGVTIAVDITGTGMLHADVDTFVKTNDSYARYDMHVNSVNSETHSLKQMMNVNSMIDVNTETEYTRAQNVGIGDMHYITNTGSGMLRTTNDIEDCEECAAGTSIDARYVSILDTSLAGPTLMSYDVYAHGSGNYAYTGFTGRSRENGSTRAMYRADDGAFSVQASYLCERSVTPEAAPEDSIKSFCVWNSKNGEIPSWRVFPRTNRT